MKFKFRFEKVLGHREEIEKQALLNMARVQARRDIELRALRALLRDSGSLKERYRSFKGQDARMEEVRRLSERIDAVREDAARQREVFCEWESKLEEARGRWNEARKAKEVLEVLKEKEFRAFVNGLEKAQTALLDEVSLRPFAMKGSRDHQSRKKAR